MTPEHPVNQKKKPNKKKGYFGRLKSFISEDVWERDLKGSPWNVRVGYYTIRLFSIVISGFITNKCKLRAAALTYAMVFSFIPLLALAFSMAGLFKGQIEEQLGHLKESIIAKLAPANVGEFEQAVERVNEFINNFHNIQLGVVGAIVLVFSVVFLLRNIEESLNDIWGITRKRSFILQVWMYWGVVTLGTIILGSSLSLTAVPNQIPVIRELIAFGPIAEFIHFITPYCITSIFLTFVYKFLPNTRIRLISALIGGATGGMLWEVSKDVYVFYVTKILRNADVYVQVYSGLAAIPLFLIWVYLSWIIFLLGAEVSYAFQNIEIYRLDRKAMKVSIRYREFLAIRIMLLVSRYFVAGKTGPTAATLAKEIQISLRLINQIADRLVRVGFLAEAAHPAGSFIPAVMLDQITPHVVLNRLRNIGSYPDADSQSYDFKLTRDLLEKSDTASAEALYSHHFRKLAEELNHQVDRENS